MAKDSTVEDEVTVEDSVEDSGQDILGITGTLISLATFVDDPFPFRERGIIPSEIVRVGQELIIEVKLDLPVDVEDPQIIGGILLIFRDADSRELVGKKFVPISIGDDSGSVRFVVPNIGNCSVAVLGRSATQRKNPPRTVTIVNPKFFRVANLRVIT